MDGYIQILINETPVGLKFAFPSVKWFAEAIQKAETDGMEAYFTKTVDDKGETIDTLTDYGLAKLMQCAYRNNCLLKEVKAELNFEHFVNWVGEHNNDEGSAEMLEVLKVYSESSVRKTIKQDSEKKSPQSQELIAV